MMTWVSERSGMASRGTFLSDHQPAAQAMATRANTKNLLFTEKSMMRLIIAFHRLCCVASGVPVEFLFALGRREVVGLALVDAGSSLSQGFFHGYACAADGVLFEGAVHPRRCHLHPALGIDEK